MRLADVMSHSGLAGYAEIGLVLFFIVFVLIVLRVLWPSRKDEVERDRMIPLDDEPNGKPEPGAKP